MRKYGSPAIRRMYNDLLMEAARAEKQRDPYVLYGMAYEGGNKNKEALDYLEEAAKISPENENVKKMLPQVKAVMK